MKRTHLIFAFLVTLLASGCNFFAPPAAEQTLVADYSGTATEMANIRASATIQSDRLSATLEYAQTAVSAVDAQSTRISATLYATGLPLIDVRDITPLFATPAATAFNSVRSAPPEFSITPIMNAQGGAQGNSTLLVQPPLTPLAPLENTQDPDAPTISDVVMTSSVGADDCPTGTTTVFATNAPGIYVSAVGHNLTPSNTIVSRWYFEGSEYTYYTWSPSFDIDQACIWFYLPGSDVAFSAGNWSVQIELDGAPIGQPALFTISGSSDTSTDAGAAGAETGAGE